MALKGQPRSFLGVNIGQANISLVELLDRGKRVELSTYALAETPPDLRNAMNASNSTAIIQLARFLRDVLEQAGVSSDAAIFSLPVTQVFTTTIELPDVPEDELSAAIFFKAEELIPVDLGEMVITVTRPGEMRHNVPLESDNSCKVVLSQGGQSGLTEMQKRSMGIQDSGNEFLINAIPSETVQWYKQLAGALELDLLALEAQVFPVMRVHPAIGEGSVLYVNVNRVEASMYIVQNCSLKMGRTIDLDMNNIGGMANFESAVSKFIHSYEQGRGGKIGRVYLLGEGAVEQGVREALASALTVPVKTSNPFSGLSFPQGVEEAVSKKGPLFTVAVGLAVRQLTGEFVV